jgi:hypothetical protein
MKISIFGIGSSSKMDCRRAFIILPRCVFREEKKNTEAEINITMFRDSNGGVGVCKQ